MFKIMLNKLRKLFIIKNKGINNKINISSKCFLEKKSRIKINGNYNNIVIEDGNYKNVTVDINGNYHNIIIQNSTRINGLNIILQNNYNSIIIGKNIGFNNTLLVSCGNNNEISIGNDSMISSNVEIWSCDGHSIFQNNKIINHSKSVKIGKHLWIGLNSKILKGAEINDGCVIGANSLISNKKFYQNSLIVGNPGKVIKENIFWTVENLEC